MTTTGPTNRVAFENDGSRVDAVAKVTGAAKYTYDIKRPGMIHARHIRSPYGDAKLLDYDLDAARAIQGVLAVEIQQEEAEYAGQPVGFICAERPQLIEDAMAALEMEWSYGRPKTSLKRYATQMAEAGDGGEAKAAAALAGAAHVVEETYETHIQHHVCLEVHCAVADYQGSKAAVWGSTQGTFSFRDGLTEDLGLDKNAIEVHCEYVGGGFGSKFGPGVEGKLAAQMSRKFGRPCRVANSRKDESRDTGMRPGTRQYYKVGVDESGKIVGGRFHTWASVGIRRGGGGVNPNKYDMGQLVTTAEEIQLSSCPPRPQRAPGHVQGAFGQECLLDDLAAKAGLDPMEMRKRNDPVEARRRQYDIVARELGWSRRLPDGTSPGPVKRGFGVAAAEWSNFAYAPARIEIRVYPDGKVEVRSGAQDIGTGTRTTLVDGAAHQMGLDRRFITGLIGSTEYPTAPASGGSVLNRSIAPAIFHAGDQAKAAVLALAGADLGVDPQTLTIAGDAIVDAQGGARRMGWEEACRLITEDHLSVTGQADAKYRGTGDSYGVCGVELEVDTETGIIRLIKIVNVQQCGVPVNRKAVESQICGGTIQGISFALFEERILNEDTGAPVNANMEAYKIAGPADMPEIVAIIDVPEGTTGVRAVGEPPIIGVSPAIANAVANAIGVRIPSLPLTPAKVLAAIQSRGGTA